MLEFDDDGVISEHAYVRRQPFIRTRYNYDTDDVSRDTALLCVQPTRAQQQFKEECDINTIIDRFGVTGTVPTNVRVPINAEFIDVMDYQEALNKIMDSEKAFMKMDAKIRNTFQNDAGKFVDFVSDPKNLDQCREWGLAPKAVVVPPPVASDPPSGGVA